MLNYVRTQPSVLKESVPIDPPGADHGPACDAGAFYDRCQGLPRDRAVGPGQVEVPNLGWHILKKVVVQPIDLFDVNRRDEWQFENEMHVSLVCPARACFYFEWFVVDPIALVQVSDE